MDLRREITTHHHVPDVPSPLRFVIAPADEWTYSYCGDNRELFEHLVESVKAALVNWKEVEYARLRAKGDPDAPAPEPYR